MSTAKKPKPKKPAKKNGKPTGVKLGRPFSTNATLDPDPKKRVAFTLSMRGDQIKTLRAKSKASGSSISAIVSPILDKALGTGK